MIDRGWGGGPAFSKSITTIIITTTTTLLLLGNIAHISLKDLQQKKKKGHQKLNISSYPNFDN